MSIPATAQQSRHTSDCGCPDNMYTSTEATQVYTFSNSKKIVACGYHEVQKGKDILSEFVLAECDSDTIIKFWDAMTSCQLLFARDTLYVQELYELPLGQGFQPEEIIWTIEQFSYKKGELQRWKYINRDIPLYDEVEVEKVLSEYTLAGNTLDNDIMALADRLFMAALSNNKAAKDAFLSFDERYPELSGAYLHQYRILTKMLKAWEASDGAL